MKVLGLKDFDESIKKGIVVVDFFANWCGPCRMMSPILEDIADELGDKVSIYKVDVDESESLARRYGVMSIPTIIIFENGEEREKHIGLWQYEDALDTIKSFL